MVKALANRRIRGSASSVLLDPAMGQESLLSPLLGNLDQDPAERFLLHSRAALGMLRGKMMASLCPIHGQLWTRAESLGLERPNRSVGDREIDGKMIPSDPRLVLCRFTLHRAPHSTSVLSA